MNSCTKILYGSNIPSGVCAVSHGVTKNPVIVCPKRMYGNNYETLRLVSNEVYQDTRFIVGGDLSSLKTSLVSERSPSVVAFGHDSGKEVQISSKSKLSFDWILQNYNLDHEAETFVAVEVQSMDTTGNYRAALDILTEVRNDGHLRPIPPSKHGINWANVHKRLLPQLIRKGKILSAIQECAGMYFVVPEIVYQRFEAILSQIDEQPGPGRDVLSIRTYTPADTKSGLKMVRDVNFLISDVASAHYSNNDEQLSRNLVSNIRKMI